MIPAIAFLAAAETDLLSPLSGNPSLCFSLYVCVCVSLLSFTDVSIDVAFTPKVTFLLQEIAYFSLVNVDCEFVLVVPVFSVPKHGKEKRTLSLSLSLCLCNRQKAIKEEAFDAP